MTLSRFASLATCRHDESPQRPLLEWPNGATLPSEATTREAFKPGLLSLPIDLPDQYSNLVAHGGIGLERKSLQFLRQLINRSLQGETLKPGLQGRKCFPGDSH